MIVQAEGDTEPQDRRAPMGGVVGLLRRREFLKAMIGSSHNLGSRSYAACRAQSTAYCTHALLQRRLAGLSGCEVLLESVLPNTGYAEFPIQFETQNRFPDVLQAVDCDAMPSSPSRDRDSLLRLPRAVNMHARSEAASEKSKRTMCLPVQY